MKNMRRILALVLTVVMVMSLSATAFADEATYSLTLNNAIEGHTYTAYQIFSGDSDEDGEMLSNIAWGTGISDEGKDALGIAAEVAESLTSVEAAEAFAVEVAPYLATAAGSATVAEDADTCVINGLAAGYYLIQTTATPDKNDVYNYYVMKIVADTNATIKASLPQVTKTLDDNDANIGDTITFTLTATMPSSLQGYETYGMTFHDTLSDGLTYTAITSVTVNGTKLTDDQYTVTHEDGQLTVSIADVLVHGAAINTNVVVVYTAVLNENAIIGTEGNPNVVYLEYSNNPNWDADGWKDNEDNDNDGETDEEDEKPEDYEEPTGETPEVEVRVYTWEIPVFKYTLDGEEEKALAGAGFTLYDEDNVVNMIAAAEGVYKVCALPECEHAEHVTEIVTGKTGKFEIEGLEQGTYILVETTTPNGYNTCADIVVVIGENGNLTQGGQPIDLVMVLNQSGTELPETGGVGTTLFYIFGSIMVVCAVVLLITKRRMSMAE